MPYPATTHNNTILHLKINLLPILDGTQGLITQEKKSMISLDIQNVTNRQNEGFARYGPTGPYIEYQLGLLPVISYKRSW